MITRFKKFDIQDFTFDDFETEQRDGKRYYLTPDGDFPSMTSILSIFNQYDTGLDEWRDRIGHEEADEITRISGARGESLHKYCELYLQNILDPTIMKGQGKILFQSIKSKVEQIQTVYGLEVALYNKDLGYAGRADAIVGLNNKLTIGDFKNSRKRITMNGWKSKKLFKYMLQCTGYALAMWSQYNLRATQGCLIVGNFDSMNSDMFIFEIGDLLINEFLIVLAAYYNNGKGIEKSLYFRL